MFEDMTNFVKMYFCKLENECGFKFLSYGWDGSRTIGLNNKFSDYDIVGIVIYGNKKTEKPDVVVGSIEFNNFLIEYKLYNFEKIKIELKKWQDVNRIYPNIKNNYDNFLVRNDVFRNQLRISLANKIYVNQEAFNENIFFVNLGSSIIDYIDYNYTRAYMNFNKFLQGEFVLVRKYLYTLYELMVIIWLIKKETLPPDFRKLLDAFILEENYRSKFLRLFDMNAEVLNKETLYIKKDENINSFILEKLIRLENDIKAYSIRNKNKFLQLSLEGNYE